MFLMGRKLEEKAMYRKKLLKGCLVAALAIAMAATSLSPVMSNGAAVVHAEETAETVTMNIQFKCGDEVVAGGDYTVPAGVQNYSYSTGRSTELFCTCSVCTGRLQDDNKW